MLNTIHKILRSNNWGVGIRVVGLKKLQKQIMVRLLSGTQKYTLIPTKILKVTNSLEQTDSAKTNSLTNNLYTKYSLSNNDKQKTVPIPTTIILNSNPLFNALSRNCS